MFNPLLKAGSGITGIDLTEGLVAHYLLNNNADDSHGVYDGAPSGGVDFQGDMASFDGVDDGITIDSALAFRGLRTISLWFFVSTTTGRNLLSYYNYDEAGSTWATIEDVYMQFGVNIDMHPYVRAFSNDNGVPVVDGNSGTEIVDSSTTIVDDSWHNYTIVTDGTSTLDFYFDGEFVGTSTILTDVITLTNDSLGLGYQYREANTANSPWYREQKISNVRIYNEAKNQAFITALYEEGYYPKPLPLPTTVGLVAHYPLTGTAEDTTGNYDGTENSMSYTDDVEFGSVSLFDGASSFVQILANGNGSSFDTQSFSIAVDAYFVDDGEDDIIFSFDYTSHKAPYYSIHLRHGNLNDNLVLGLNYDETYQSVQSATATIPYGEWRHILITVENGSQKIYDENTLIASETHTGTIYFYDQEIWIGKANYASLMCGRLRNLRFYNSVLTETERTNIYNYEKNFRPIDIDDGLVAYYPLANNSLDNYHNEYDGDDTDMTYDGLSGVFNGTTSYIDAPISGTHNIITVTGWLNATASNSNRIGSILLGATHRFDLYTQLTTGFLRFQGTEAGISGSPSSGVIADDTNHFFCFEIDTVADVVTFFVDAVNVGTLAIQGTLLNTITSFEIGRVSVLYSPHNSNNIRVYNKALTAEQVEVIYNTEKGDFE